MAVVFISEFPSGVSFMGSAVAQMLPQPPLAEQTVAIGGSSVQSNAFNAGTKAVLVTTDAPCSIAFGADPTATATTLRLPAGAVIAFGVAPGSKLAVITNS